MTLPPRCRRRSRRCRTSSIPRQRSTTCCHSTTRRSARWNAPRPNLTAGRTVFTYSGELTGVPASAAPRILDKSYTITAEVEIPEGGAEGMIVTEGGRFGGYGLFLSKGVAGIRRGKVVFLYNLLDLKRTIWEGPELEPGKHTIVFDFKSDGPGLGKGGTGVLSVDGKEVARNSMEHTTPVTFPEDETFDIGQDTRTGVALVEYRYDVPFKFTGKINKLTFKLEPEPKAAKLEPMAAPEPILLRNRSPSSFGSLPTGSVGLETRGNRRDEKGAHFCCYRRGAHRRCPSGGAGICHPGASWHGRHRAHNFGWPSDRHRTYRLGRGNQPWTGVNRNVDLYRARCAVPRLYGNAWWMGRSSSVASHRRACRPRAAACRGLVGEKSSKHLNGAPRLLALRDAAPANVDYASTRSSASDAVDGSSPGARKRPGIGCR